MRHLSSRCSRYDMKSQRYVFRVQSNSVCHCLWAVHDRFTHIYLYVHGTDCEQLSIYMCKKMLVVFDGIWGEEKNGGGVGGGCGSKEGLFFF